MHLGRFHRSGEQIEIVFRKTVENAELRKGILEERRQDLVTRLLVREIRVRVIGQSGSNQITFREELTQILGVLRSEQIQVVLFWPVLVLGGLGPKNALDDVPDEKVVLDLAPRPLQVREGCLGIGTFLNPIRDDHSLDVRMHELQPLEMPERECTIIRVQIMVVGPRIHGVQYLQCVLLL